MKVNICGIPHEIVYEKDKFDTDLHLGEIKYAEAKIVINEDAAHSVRDEALCHEIIHGILIHIGRNDLTCDEQFVQGLANAVYQTFDVRLEE